VERRETLGSKEDGVGITRNEVLQEDDPCRFLEERWTELINKIVKGEIKGRTVF